MRGALRITKRNWKHFENSLDSLTKEPYKIGDKVIKCSECKLIFHAEYLEGEKCPSCRKPFVPAGIETRVIHLGYDRKIVPRRAPKTPAGRNRWNQDVFFRRAVRCLNGLGTLGLVFSVGLLIWAVVQSGLGWEGWVSWMSGAVLPGAVFRLQQAAWPLAKLSEGMQALLGRIADQLTPTFGQLELVFEAVGATIEELIGRLEQLG